MGRINPNQLTRTQVPDQSTLIVINPATKIQGGVHGLKYQLFITDEVDKALLWGPIIMGLLQWGELSQLIHYEKASVGLFLQQQDSRISVSRLERR